MSDTNYFSKQYITKIASNGDIVLKHNITSNHQQQAITNGKVNLSLNSSIKNQQQQCSDTLCNDKPKIS